ncbi:hypothetical protein MAPG_01779 [Magnaporthiopsis poae ATCC 64411]|uniref:Uncharacterized protein n=1 Tax=Magnaporthiopsis poae (strain ATCC 64411 / 73-15) TaxID=644358 RepID=A0A0C4DPL0_MAGP6|nr:hypothetical protein MAPG_01779 [Magnaporthiopsis poae ATCC 64411]
MQAWTQRARIRCRPDTSALSASGKALPSGSAEPDKFPSCSIQDACPSAQGLCGLARSKRRPLHRLGWRFGENAAWQPAPGLDSRVCTIGITPKGCKKQGQAFRYCRRHTPRPSYFLRSWPACSWLLCLSLLLSSLM